MKNRPFQILLWGIVVLQSCNHVSSFSSRNSIGLTTTTTLSSPLFPPMTSNHPSTCLSLGEYSQKQQQQQPLLLTARNRRPTTSLKAMASGAAAAAAAVGVFPSLTSVVAACLGPTLLGFYKSEYGVSYGYGTATALTAYLALVVNTPVSGWAKWHALAVLFYGIRLNLYLLYRELCLPRFRDMRERIEQRAISKGGRLRRAPFIFSCAGLYAGLASPTLITSKLSSSSLLLLSSSSPLIRIAIVGTWMGFALGALGDITKSFVKAKDGSDTLVTGGIYRFVRHPNYTGEIIGWTCNALVALLASITNLKAVWPALLLSLASVPGIISVLLAATVNLEVKQRNAYGTTQKYKDWIQNSWIGFSLQVPQAENKKMTE